jgi:hypothetical protein
MMKKLSLLVLFFVSTISFGQIEDALVFLEAKDPTVVAAALADPSTILSQAALDRKTAQGTSIDDRDVPLNETQMDECCLRSWNGNQYQQSFKPKFRYSSRIYGQEPKQTI